MMHKTDKSMKKNKKYLMMLGTDKNNNERI